MTKPHPEAQAILAELDTLGIPSFSTLSTTGVTSLYQKVFSSDRKPEPVERTVEFIIDGPGGNLHIRVYDPDPDLCVPVLVYAHGGGWMLGGLESHDLECRMLANRTGCLVAAVDYRLAPQHTFPAPVKDMYTAIEWLSQHAEQVGGRSSEIAVAGDSSGGNIAAAVAQYDRDIGAGLLRHQLLIYPATDYRCETESYEENEEGYFLTKQDMEFFWEHYLGDELNGRHPYASPLLARDHTDLPPATIVTAGFDPLRDDGKRYANQLQSAGVPVDYLAFPEMIHGFFHMPRRLEAGAQVHEEIGSKVSEAMGVSN